MTLTFDLKKGDNEQRPSPRLHTRPPGTRVRALRAVDRLARVGRPSHRARTDRDRERSGRRRDAGGVSARPS